MQSLEIAYDQLFALPPCQFVFENEGLENSRFLGWNTARDGSGESFADEASVVNLCDKAGASVTFYTQWEDPEPAPGPDPEPGPDPDPSPSPSPDPEPSDEPKPVPSPDTPISSDASEPNNDDTSAQIPNTSDRAVALLLSALAASSLTLALAVLCLKTRGTIRKESK